MSRYVDFDEFHGRHGRQKFTPQYNESLHSAIVNRNLALETRVWAWIFRNSWGRFSDACCDDEAVIQNQSDCARELGVPRQAVNPIFCAFRDQGFIRIEGHEIIAVDDPRGIFANSSNHVCTFPTNPPDSDTAFQAWFSTRWAQKHPVEYAEWCALETRRKELRMPALNEYRSERRDQKRAATAGMSGPRTSGHCAPSKW